VTKRPKHMLIELPTADEIDDLAITTPEFEVRKIEYDRSDRKADLNYPPCKGQVVVVVRGPSGIAMVREKGARHWGLPSGRLRIPEVASEAARRVAREQCGIGLRRVELAGIYDVISHFSDVSVKRLHMVFAAETDDAECVPGQQSGLEAMFSKDPGRLAGDDDLLVSALKDSEKK